MHCRTSSSGSFSLLIAVAGLLSSASVYTELAGVVFSPRGRSDRGAEPDSVVELWFFFVMGVTGASNSVGREVSACKDSPKFCFYVMSIPSYLSDDG